MSKQTERVGWLCCNCRWAVEGIDTPKNCPNCKSKAWSFTVFKVEADIDAYNKKLKETP